mmetsp:Transcript_40754/g.49437  ORF Transcript_40754/g.49437 Transcript_40754/m.49437 type:complete len:387 (-) Transcript_40754:386-1546(-)
MNVLGHMIATQPVKYLRVLPRCSSLSLGIASGSSFRKNNTYNRKPFQADRMSVSASAAPLTGDLPNWTWQQSMLRIKDPEKSLKFYEEVLGMTLVDKYDFEQWKFSLYFLQSLPEGEAYNLTPGSDEAHKYLWSMPGVTVELTHNWGTEKEEGMPYHPGNAEKDGFGHLAYACEDVYKACEEMEKQNVQFRKKPDEGRMKGLAFALDPDGYWIEIVQRGALPGAPKFTLAQTMLRIKDPKKSIPFYTEQLGMTLVRESHFNDFSLYFLATLPVGTQTPDPTSEEGKAFVKDVLYPSCIPVLELTHNHGTENDADFVHHNGNVEPNRGFGHIGYLVDDVYAASAELEANGVEFQKKPDEGGMKGLAFAKDPDGYWIEIIKRGQEGKF